LAKGRQLTFYDLALDLNPHNQKKKYHQAVINPVVQVHREKRAATYLQWKLPKREIERAPGRIRPSEGDNGCSKGLNPRSRCGQNDRASTSDAAENGFDWRRREKFP